MAQTEQTPKSKPTPRRQRNESADKTSKPTPRPAPKPAPKPPFTDWAMI